MKSKYEEDLLLSLPIYSLTSTFINQLEVSFISLLVKYARMIIDRLSNLSIVSSSSSSSSSGAAANLNQDSGMGNVSFCDDLLYDNLCKLSQKDLVKCKMVFKSWHQIISHVRLGRFWS